MVTDLFDKPGSGHLGLLLIRLQPAGEMGVTVTGYKAIIRHHSS